MFNKPSISLLPIIICISAICPAQK